MSTHVEIMAKLRKNLEVRNLSRQIRKLHTAELKARLRSLGANTNGPKDLRQDRLLRAVLWCTGYPESVPWYDWDNAKDEPTQSSENSTSRRNSKRTRKQTYGEETEKIRVTKMKSRCDYVDRGEDHENQHSSSKAKAQHQKEKMSKKKIRRLRGRVRSRNRSRSRSFSSRSSSSSSDSSSNLSLSRSRARRRSPNSSRSSRRASQSSSINSRSSSVSSCNSHHLEPEPVRATIIAEPVNYNPTFDNCQVCGLKNVIFQNCPNCAKIRMLLGKWQCGDKSEVDVNRTVSHQTSSGVQKTRHTRSVLQRGMPVLGGGVSGPSPLESPGWKLRRKSSREIAKADITCRPSPLRELGAKSQEISIAAADVNRRPRNLERIEDEKKNFVEKNDVIEEETFFVEEEEKLFVEEENFWRRENNFVEEEKFFVNVGITCRPKQEIVVEEAEEQKTFANAGVIRRLSNKTTAGAVTARPSSSGVEKRDSVVRWNLDVIPTSRISSPMVTDHCGDSKAQPVMLSPAANSRDRIRETLARYKRKNESKKKLTFLPLTKLQTSTQPQLVLQSEQVNRRDASSISDRQPDDTIEKYWKTALTDDEEGLCCRRMCVEEKKTYANADATRRLSNVSVTKPRTIASADTAWPSSSDEKDEKSRCRVVKLYRSVIPTSINNCLSSHKVADRQKDANIQPVQLKSAAHSRRRIMEATAQDEKKNESGENPRFSSLSILQPKAHFQPVSQPEQQGQDVSSTLDMWLDDAITEFRKTAFVDGEKLLEQEVVEDVQGVLARDGREELVAQNNTAVVFQPAREVEVVDEDVTAVKIVEPKVNLAMLDGVFDSTGRGFAALEERCLGGKDVFRRRTLVEAGSPSDTVKIRLAKQRIMDRLTAINDVTKLRRILSRVEKISKEEAEDQLEEEKIMKLTIVKMILKQDVDEQMKEEVVGSMVRVKKEDTGEPLEDEFTAQVLTVNKPEKPEVQHSCLEPVHKEEGDLKARRKRRIFTWVEDSCRTVFDRGKGLNEATTTTMATNKDVWPEDVRRVAYRALFDRGRDHSPARSEAERGSSKLKGSASQSESRVLHHSQKMSILNLFRVLSPFLWLIERYTLVLS